MFLPRYNTDRLSNKKKLLEMKFLSGLETTRYRMLTEEQIENEIPRKSELLFTFLDNTNIKAIKSQYYMHQIHEIKILCTSDFQEMTFSRVLPTAGAGNSHSCHIP